MLVAWGRAGTPAGRRPQRCRTSRVCAASAEPAALVPQDALGEADALRPGARDRVEADPLAGRLAHQVDRQLRVDEEPAAEVERRADAVAGVGRHEHAGQRRVRLALDQRLAHAQPDLAGPGLQEPAGEEAVVHRGVVADRLAGGEERLLAARVGPGRRCSAGPATRGAVARAQPPGGRARDLVAVLGGQRSAADQLDVAPGPQRPRWRAVSGASGTGRRTSTVIRPTTQPSRSSARPSSAEGGPACCAPGSHGPRVSSEGRKTSPRRV